MADGNLLYQPSHGLGVEMWVVHDAANLAKSLGLRLTLPRLGPLESTDFLYEIEELFEIPDGLAGDTTHAFLAAGPTVVPRLDVLPIYLTEYTDSRISMLHPTWLRIIREAAYFVQVGIDTRHARTISPPRPLSDPELANVLAPIRAEHLAVSYLNGLCEQQAPIQTAADDFDGRSFSPCVPCNRWLRIAHRTVGTPQVAVHIRRGNLVEPLSLKGISLPSVSDYRRIAGSEVGHVYCATDEDAVWHEFEHGTRLLPRIGAMDPVSAAMVELSICATAERFVGTRESTFSHLISAARRALGHSATSTVLVGPGEL